MKLKPWYDVVKPRADLREGKPLDAAEFAVHLDKVQGNRAMSNNPCKSTAYNYYIYCEVFVSD